MNRSKSLFIVLLIINLGCISKKESPHLNAYPRWVDDISFDPSKDNIKFIVCHGEDSILQYFNNGQGLEYEGEKYEIIKDFDEKYDPEIAAKESGLIRIRFLVNCHGETVIEAFSSYGLSLILTPQSA